MYLDACDCGTLGSGPRIDAGAVSSSQATLAPADDPGIGMPDSTGRPGRRSLALEADVVWADLSIETERRRRLCADLYTALSRNEFALAYQPYVTAATGAVAGFEALLRWRHPAYGEIQPAEFVPLAEEIGLIVPIGAWVMNTACREAATWPEGIRISVNISPIQFRDRGLPQRIARTLRESGLAARKLELEITEAIRVADAAAALSSIMQIRALGVAVALDDFGTGYSSLSYLQHFPFDRLKIDRSFIHNFDTRPKSQILVRAMRDIARSLGLAITAEGVETEREAELLREAGCEELQGFLYGRPLGIEDTRRLLPCAVHAPGRITDGRAVHPCLASQGRRR